MYINRIIFFTLVLLLCKGANAQQLSKSERTILDKNTAYQSVVKYYSGICKPSKWTWRFMQSKVIVKDESYCNVDSLSKSLRKVLMIPSPDNRKFIDGFGGFELEKDGDKVIFSADVDQAIYLLNKKDSSRTQVFFSGPGGGIFTAGWVSNDQFIMLGHSWQYPDTLSNTSKPPLQFELYWCDVNKNSIRMYLGPVVSWDRFHSLPWYRSKELQKMKELYPKSLH